MFVFTFLLQFGDLTSQFLEVAVLRHLQTDVYRVGECPDPLDSDLLVFGVVDSPALDLIDRGFDRSEASTESISLYEADVPGASSLCMTEDGYGKSDT